MSGDLDAVPTERRNPRSVHIDRLPTIDVVRLINAEDATVPGAVAAALPQLAVAVELAVAALAAGRRMHYFGAGTSGRLAALDAAELIPTYGLRPDQVVAHLAGGWRAMLDADAGAEDNEAGGTADAGAVRAGDLAVGITASGCTPYVAGALRQAQAAGAGTVLVSSNPDAPLAVLADVHVAVDTGAEVITGSTRMKAGTAQKLVLNTLSTATMVRLGRTYTNLMIDVGSGNDKLRWRQVRILAEATGADLDACADALRQAGGDLRAALAAVNPEAR